MIFQLEFTTVSHLFGWRHHNTFLSGDKRMTGCSTAAFQVSAKGQVFAAESKLPDPCPCTDPGMLCATAAVVFANCKGHKIPKYPIWCSSSYISPVSVLLYHGLFWEAPLVATTDVQVQRFLKSFHCFKLGLDPGLCLGKSSLRENC